MKINNVLKNLVVIAALSGFCMPTQAMWVFNKIISSSSERRDEAVEKIEFISKCVAQEKVNAVDRYGKTALEYAIQEKDVSAVYDLLSCGALIKNNSDKVDAYRLLGMMFDEGSCTVDYRINQYENCMHSLKEYTFMKQLAFHCKDGVVKRMQKRYLHRSETTGYEMLFDADSKVLIDQALIQRFQQAMPWRDCGLLFKALLCSCDPDNLQRFIPVIAKNKELLECCMHELNTFACLDYKDEITKGIRCEQARTDYEETRNTVWCRMLNNTKSFDTHLRFK